MVGVKDWLETGVSKPTNTCQTQKDDQSCLSWKKMRETEAT